MKRHNIGHSNWCVCAQKIYKLTQIKLSQFVYFAFILREREEKKHIFRTYRTIRGWLKGMKYFVILAIKGQTRNIPVILSTNFFISLCSNSQKLQICVDKFVYSIWYIIQVHTDALAQWAPNLLITGLNPGPFLTFFFQK